MTVAPRRGLLIAIALSTLMLNTASVEAQTLTGRATVVETGAAAAGYFLRLMRERVGSATAVDSAYTDARGSFTFKNMGAGTYRLIGGTGGAAWREPTADSLTADDVVLHDVSLPKRFMLGSRLLGDTVRASPKTFYLPPRGAKSLPQAQGVMYFIVHVDTAGRVMRDPAPVLRGGTPELERAMTATAMKMVFTPATVDGRAIVGTWCNSIEIQRGGDPTFTLSLLTPQERLWCAVRAR